MATTSTTFFGVTPDKATQRSVTSQNKFLKGISYPLAKSRTKEVFGDIQQVTNVNYFTPAVNKELITGMLRQLFLTKKGERIMNPDFGLDLKEYVFSPLDITTFEIVRADIISQMAIFVPFVEILKLSIFESSPTIADNGIMIHLTLKIKDINFTPPFEVKVNVG